MEKQSTYIEVTPRIKRSGRTKRNMVHIRDDVIFFRALTIYGEGKFKCDKCSHNFMVGEVYVKRGYGASTKLYHSDCWQKLFL